jgi:rare lipoprotein A
MRKRARHWSGLLAVLLLAGCQSLQVTPVATPAPPLPPVPAGQPAPAAPASAPVSPDATPPATPAAKAEPFRNIYRMEKDTAPLQQRDVDYMAIPDAVPRTEPRGKYGNKSPYSVNGRTYRVLESARGYRAEGMASWYGEKFHGHRTSSFEPYDMYAMTAAHTTLPIPSYVRVTNLDNGRAVIVRVNDRGPFHRGRIIDLSWAAAQRLGYANVGTARVRVETVEPEAEIVVAAAEPADEAQAPPAPAVALPGAPAAQLRATPPPEVHTASHGFFVQLGAFAFPDAARSLAERARAAAGEPVSVLAGEDTLHRVRVGPYEDRASAERIRDLLLVADLGTPALVFVPPAARADTDSAGQCKPAPC